MTTATVRRAALLNYFSLFSSLSTLFCCALPSVLVLLGMGSTVASLLSAAPWLVGLSRHKQWTFAISGSLIALSMAMTFLISPRLRSEQSCNADHPDTCNKVGHISRLVLVGSACIWMWGFFIAYLLGPILERIDS